MKKGFLQISFPWLFAIIVGGFILFLAIYSVTKITDTQQTISTTITGKELGILLNPLEIGFESSKTIPISMPAESRIYNKCNDFGEFGQQIIQVSERSFNAWTDVGLNAPFEFPFKVADLIYFTSAEKNYCFVNSPEDIEEELLNLNQPNLFAETCPENSIQVCFNSDDCEINVEYYSGIVRKGEQTFYFETDALMYGAIFSSKGIYECQTGRVMQRLKNLALLYKDKSRFIFSQGCSNELDAGLLSLSNFADNYQDSEDLSSAINTVEDLRSKNDFAVDCRLW